MSATRKTIKEWLKELPDGYQERAIENTDDDVLEFCVEGPIGDVLNKAFTWSNTIEQHKFWLSVYEYYCYSMPLPPLP